MVLTQYECDREAAPPTRNEVFVCSKKTRTEEVIFFLLLCGILDHKYLASINGTSYLSVL